MEVRQSENRKIHEICLVWDSPHSGQVILPTAGIKCGELFKNHSLSPWAIGPQLEDL